MTAAFEKSGWSTLSGAHEVLGDGWITRGSVFPRFPSNLTIGVAGVNRLLSIRSDASCGVILHVATGCFRSWLPAPAVPGFPGGGGAGWDSIRCTSFDRERPMDWGNGFSVGRSPITSHQGRIMAGAPGREEGGEDVAGAPGAGVKARGPRGRCGAGSGYFLAPGKVVVGPTGTVYTNDIQPEILAILSTNVAARV